MPAKLMTPKQKDVVVALLLTAAIYLADVFAPSWYDVWVLYLVPLFFMFRSAQQPYLFSAAVTLLMATGLVVPHADDVPFTHSALNRITAIIGGWGVSLLLMRLKRLNYRLLEAEEDRYRSLSENMQEGFAYCRMVFQDERPVDFVYLHVNRSFGALTGLRDVVGRKVTEVIPGIRESYPEMFETFAHVAMSGQPARFELYITQLRAWLSFSVYSTEKEHFITVFENITDRKNREEELRSQSLTDELTGLYNRRGFLTFAEKLGQMAKRQHKGLAMLYADIDGMKEINDTWGHQEGDAALVEIAGILRATYRESDVIARIGGDEFVVFPVGASGEDSETSLARLYHNIDAHNATRKKGYNLAMSCGLSYFDPANPLTINELLGHADRLMYDRKREARRRLNGEQ